MLFFPPSPPIANIGYLTKEEFMILADIIVRQYSKKASERTAGKYAIGKKIGQGAMGVVHVAKDTTTGIRKAVKIIKRGDCADLSRLDTEIRVMTMLHHPNIVELEEVLESPHSIYFVMKLCGGGNLAEYVNVKPFPENVARGYFGQLVQAMIYCHSQGVCHRDLKLENLLLDNEGRLHIADFGQVLFCFVLFCFVLFCFVLFCFVLFFPFSPLLLIRVPFPFFTTGWCVYGRMGYVFNGLGW